MIRLSVLWLAVFAVGVYTWIDWFKGLCGLVLLVGILEYPDVPKSIFGITGLNFFNVLLVNIALAWVVNRSREKLTWDMPAHLNVLLTLFVMIILFGWTRMIRDRGFMTYISTTGSLTAEYLINTIKWMVPCLLLFDGCRSRDRLKTAAFAILGAYVFLGLMVIKVMPLGSALLSGAELQRLALRLLQSRIGYHRVTLSMMLGGAVWALVAAMPLLKDRRLRMTVPFLAVGLVYAQALTGGRAGYITLGAVGFILAALRWRKVFLIAPAVALLFVMFVPSAIERLTFGLTRDPYKTGDVAVDEYELTSGRNLIWPYVIAQIWQKPIFGWGRQAMLRTGTVTFLSETLNEDFGHPHNAYLESLLDNGIVGFIPTMALFLVLVFHGLRLFLERRSVLCSTAGGIAASLVLALMVAGMSSQSFYPIEGTVEMWAAIGLMLRLSVERARVLKLLEAPKRALAFAPGLVWNAAPPPQDFDTLIWHETPVSTIPVRGPVPLAAPSFAARPAGASWRQTRPPVRTESRPRYRF